MNAIERILERLDGVRQEAGYFVAFCPAHDDKEQSLSISQGTDGRVLMKCHAGCAAPDVVAALGLGMRDLFERNGHNEQGGRGVHTPPKTRATVQPCNPCSLEAYAEAKGLPVEFLRELGLSTISYMGRKAVRIPYLTEDGREVAVRLRLALEKSPQGDNRFRWRKGSKLTLYGLWRLERIRKAGYVVLVEGESDCHTLWHHGIAALGVPGASSWRAEWGKVLEGIEKVYAVIEPDRGGEAFREKLGASGIAERLYLVDLGDHKDASGLYLSGRADFEKRFRAALEAAVPYAEHRRAEEEARARDAWEACKGLATDPDILDRFAGDLACAGVAGESRVAKLLYLAVTSRLLEKPVSVAVKGPSSGGKSFLVERVLDFFPESAYYALTAMSEHALAYSGEPLSHRFLILYEAAGMSGDFQTYLMRSLLSEGRLRYETVEKTSEGMQPRLIEREGPTGLIVTTTAVKLHPENETRLISLTVTDTPDQTRAVLEALASEAAGDGPDLEAWRSLQSWLEGRDRSVTVPYARELARLIPPVAVRLRRDFGAVLNLIRAHAVLHQARRERDAAGRIVATIEDYAKVRELVADLVSEGIEATVPATIRETVEALKALYDDEEEPATITELAGELQLDKSSAWRRVRSAMDRGYIRNLEDRRGRPARLVPGDALPDDIEVLPDPERLQGCTVAVVSEGIDTPPPHSKTPANTDVAKTASSSDRPAAEVRALLESPPQWLARQMDACRAAGNPKQLLLALAAAVASEVLSNPRRADEVLPTVEAFMTGGH
ncbi:MAG: hypothetical protein IRY88_17030 [Rubrobacteraceae bacterium]|nr:hypothetical protein [Rubrobacteraceae bacterium]